MKKTRNLLVCLLSVMLVMLSFPAIAFSANMYNVTYTLTNMTASNQPTTINANTALNVTLTPESDYGTPDSVTVKVNGSELRQGSDYYLATLGGGKRLGISISASAVKGDIEIIAAGKKLVLSDNANLSSIYYLANMTRVDLTAEQIQQAKTDEGISITLPHDTWEGAYMNVFYEKEDSLARVTENYPKITNGKAVNVITVTAENGDQQTYTLNFTVDPVHNWEPEWSWAEDYLSATVILNCIDNSDHTETPEVTVTSQVTNATCTEDGKIIYTATASLDDGQTFTDTQNVTINAIGHSLTKVERMEPTYTSTGNIEYWYCENCDKYFSDEAATQEIAYEDTIIPMLEQEPDTTTENDDTDTSDTSDTTQANDTEKNTSAQSEKKGSATSPKTGADENFALIWVSVLAACAAVLTTATVYKRKRKYSK